MVASADSQDVLLTRRGSLPNMQPSMMYLTLSVDLVTIRCERAPLSFMKRTGILPRLALITCLWECLMQQKKRDFHGPQKHQLLSPYIFILCVMLLLHSSQWKFQFYSIWRRQCERPLENKGEAEAEDATQMEVMSQDSRWLRDSEASPVTHHWHSDWYLSLEALYNTVCCQRQGKHKAIPLLCQFRFGTWEVTWDCSRVFWLYEVIICMQPVFVHVYL